MRPWPEQPPAGPFRRGFWRSPLRGPWLTAVLGLTLLVTMPLIALTGLFSNAAYDPRLGGNAAGRHLGPLDFYLFSWPAHPTWLYALNQGLHVTLGLATVPIVLAKLWSVIPRLFEWPPLRSPAHALERISLALLVGGTVFEFATGVLNIQDDYAFSFFFTDAHYYGAWVVIAALAFHISVKLPTLRSTLAGRRAILAPLREDAEHTRPEPRPDSDLVATAPAAPTMSRRALLGTVGAGSLLLALQGAGQSIGGPLRRFAFLAPRGRNPGGGPNGFQVNATFAETGIDPAMLAGGWRLALSGTGKRLLSRTQLLALPQHTYDLPIACVEGWSTTQRWTGVRLSDLALLAGVKGAAELTTVSVEQGTPYAQVTLSAAQVAAPQALLALRVNGADLSLDHGYPARIIGPALPGVHCTKWVQSLSFRSVA
jgi:DMSO/TMAO reductase YedYZ molybdopterin-dependent catalytic subunit